MVRSRRPVPIIHPMSNAKVTPAQLANLPPGFVSTAEAFPGLPPPLSPSVPPPPTPPTVSKKKFTVEYNHEIRVLEME